MSQLPDPTQSNPEAKAIYDKIDKTRGGHHYPGLFEALCNYPELAEAFATFGQFLRFQGKLPSDVREVAILTIAAILKNSYEWETHQPNAKAAGLKPDLIQRILKKEKLNDDPVYEKVQRLVHVFLNLQVVPQFLQNELVQDLGMESFLQLSVVINYYRMVAGLVTGFEFSLEKENTKEN
jgi:4-carboxymuconolactone decarboxylase